jgi:epoxyqueuosine reductase
MILSARQPDVRTLCCTIALNPASDSASDPVLDGAHEGATTCVARRMADQDLSCLWQDIVLWAKELGFHKAGVSDVDLSSAEEFLADWLKSGFHGEMEYMERHGMKRARPAELVPGTLRVLSFSLNYLPESVGPRWIERSWQALEEPEQAVVSRYAHGRDYHKVSRSRLQRLAERIEERVGPFGYRVFTDSAPVLEVELAQRSGIGWRGKHTLALSRDAGSMFFLGEIFIDVPLPVTAPAAAHCGRCERCITVCPTQAIVAPYKLDARRCISYLTIEHAGSIPVQFRRAMGNRIYGCDDCQLVCPWNKFAKLTPLADFEARGLEHNSLVELFMWSEHDFLAATEGSAIRRIGHARWLRNIATALGNALSVELSHSARHSICQALETRRAHADAVVREHVEWALTQLPQVLPHGAPHAPA